MHALRNFLALASVAAIAGGAGAERPVRSAYLREPDFWISSAPGGAPAHHVDRITFPAGSDSMRVEIVYAISYAELRFVALEGDRWRARVNFDLTFVPEGQERPLRRLTPTRTVDAESAVVEAAANYQLLHVVRTTLPRGAYWVESSVSNAAGEGARAKSHFWVDPPGIGSDGTIFGEIQLAYEIRRADAASDSHFTKGRFEVRPNPVRRYTPRTPMLLFYTEIFNPRADTLHLQTRYTVEDLYGKPVKDLSGGVLALRPGTNANSGGMNVVTLPTGFYRLALTYRDSEGEIAARRSRIFVFQRATEAPEPPDLYITTLTDADLETYGDQFLKYLADPKDRQAYDLLPDGPARRRFIENWWAKEAEARGLSTEAYRAEILKRYEEADRRYADPYREGWRSDRGRIYIRYGEPLEVERLDFERSGQSAEIWHYVVRGERKFCYFTDRRGSGKYELQATDLDGEEAPSREMPNLEGDSDPF